MICKQLWDSSRWPGKRLRAGGEAPVYHVKAAHVWQLTPHMVFLLQGVHHSLPGVRLDFHKTCMKVADLTGERKLEKQMQWLWHLEVLEWQQRSLNMLNLHSLKAKAPQRRRRSLKENKRVARHTLFASAQFFSMKNVQDDSSSSKTESHSY